MAPNESVLEACDGTDVFGASWEDLGGVDWISKKRKVRRKQNGEITENQEVADGACQGSVCGRMGGDRSELEPSDDTMGFGGLLGGFLEHFGVSRASLWDVF